MSVATSLRAAFVMLSLVVSSFAQVQAQDKPIDVVYSHIPARSAIEQLGKFLGKNVVFDFNFPPFPNAPIDFTARDVPRSQALEKLVQDQGFFSVEVAGVTIVARDSADVRDNYNAARVAACAIAGQKASRTDVVYHSIELKLMLEQLAKVAGRTAGFDSAPARVHLRTNVEMRNVTYEEALQIICLIGHFSVTDDGKHLEFSAAQISK
jgi:hypothetical protein